MLRKIAGAIFIALFVIWIFGFGWAVGWSSRVAPYKQLQTRSAQQSSEGDKAHLQHRPFGDWITHDAAGFFTFWLVVIGFGQAGLFVWQLLLIGESLTDAKKAADAANNGAKAARESADTSKLAMVASERAYVHYNGCRWNSHPDRRDGHIFWRLRPAWINSGNTPTRKLSVYVHYELLDHELPADYAFVPDEIAVATPAMIALKGMVESGPRNIDGAELVEVAAGRKYLYVWGIAKYRDVFPGTPERVTKFCAKAMQVTGDPLAGWDENTNLMDIHFATYAQHNCTDEECNQQT